MSFSSTFVRLLAHSIFGIVPSDASSRSPAIVHLTFRADRISGRHHHHPQIAPPPPIGRIEMLSN
jgi:hypothetical protein